MLSKEELAAQYENYSDEELYTLYRNIGGYSEEAQQAFEMVMEKKGGIDSVIQRLQVKQSVLQEEKRVRKEVTEFGRSEADLSFIKKMISSEILSADRLDAVIEDAYSDFEHEQEDKKVKPKTVAGSLAGGLLAGLIGGAIWGFQMIWSGRMFYLLLVGLGLLSYALIRAFTRQSAKNTMVFVATILSVLLALLIGFILYTVIGYRGPGADMR